MFKLQAAQVFAQGGGDHAACQAIALQARGDQWLGHEQDAFARIDQCIGDLGVQVQRLVGGDGPGGGGPDDHEGFFGQLGQAKGGCQLGRVVGFEGHVQRRAAFVLVLDLKLGQ
ncbi:hypothetical protein D3C72_1880290 [compost metagenome]